VNSLSQAQRRLIWIGCLVPFVSSIVLMLWYWPGSLPQDSTSGVWTALAQDFANGILYRPTADAYGFGGTRYMPLFFVLHGTLIRLSLDPIVAGLLLTVASIVLFDLALLSCLRALDVPWSLAVPLSVLCHAAVSFQLLSLQVKGDFLAAALNLWGISFGLRYARTRSPLVLWCCAVALLGAFLTKFTALWGAVAVCVWLVRRGERRQAVTLAAVLAALAVGALALIQWASDGRALASFRAVASGGARPGYALGAPLWFLLVALQDPVFVSIVAVAALYAAALVGKARISFPVGYFLLAAAGTLAIFTSPGTDSNHFIDLLGAAVLLLGWRLTRAAGPPAPRPAVGLAVALAGLTALTWVPGMISIKSLIEKGGRPERWKVAAIVQALGPQRHDLLSENPLLPVMAGQRPRVLDPFNLRLLAREHPDVAADFTRRMRDASFGAVVLVDFTGADRAHIPAALRACTASAGDRCYGGVVFPPGFLDLLDREYVLRFVERPFVVYEPRLRRRQLGGMKAVLLSPGGAAPGTPDRRLQPVEREP